MHPEESTSEYQPSAHTVQTREAAVSEYLPTGQALQTSAPTGTNFVSPSSTDLAATRPAGHAMHVADPASATRPAPHEVQSAIEVIPELFDALPAGHLEHWQFTKQFVADTLLSQVPYHPTPQGETQKAPNFELVP